METLAEQLRDLGSAGIALRALLDARLREPDGFDGSLRCGHCPSLSGGGTAPRETASARRRLHARVERVVARSLCGRICPMVLDGVKSAQRSRHKGRIRHRGNAKAAPNHLESEGPLVLPYASNQGRIGPWVDFLPHVLFS